MRQPLLPGWQFSNLINILNLILWGYPFLWILNNFPLSDHTKKINVDIEYSYNKYFKILYTVTFIFIKWLLATYLKWRKANDLWIFLKFINPSFYTHPALEFGIFRIWNFYLKLQSNNSNNSENQTCMSITLYFLRLVLKVYSEIKFVKIYWDFWLSMTKKSALRHSLWIRFFLIPSRVGFMSIYKKRRAKKFIQLEAMHVTRT